MDKYPSIYLHQVEAIVYIICTSHLNDVICYLIWYIEDITQWEIIWIFCLSGKNNISQVSAATSEILFLQWEHKIHVFQLTCNVLFITKKYWWRHFWRFSKDFWPLTWTLPNIFLKIPLITIDFQRLSKIAKDFWGRPEDVLIIHQQI